MCDCAELLAPNVDSILAHAVKCGANVFDFLKEMNLPVKKVWARAQLTQLGAEGYDVFQRDKYPQQPLEGLTTVDGLFMCKACRQYVQTDRRQVQRHQRTTSCGRGAGMCKVSGQETVGHQFVRVLSVQSGGVGPIRPLSLTNSAVPLSLPNPVGGEMKTQRLVDLSKAQLGHTQQFIRECQWMIGGDIAAVKHDRLTLDGKDNPSLHEGILSVQIVRRMLEHGQKVIHGPR